MNVCTSCFERGSRPVVGSSSSRSTGEVSSARASATFCCMPRDRFSIGSPRRAAGKADALQDHRDLLVGLARAHAVEPRRVGEVLGGAHLLEEAGLDRDAVDEPLHLARLLEHVVPEDVRGPAVLQQQRREQPDERRLPGAVLTEDRDALAPFQGEADVAQRSAAAPMHALAAREGLRKITYDDCG